MVLRCLLLLCYWFPVLARVVSCDQTTVLPACPRCAHWHSASPHSVAQRYRVSISTPCAKVKSKTTPTVSSRRGRRGGSHAPTRIRPICLNTHQRCVIMMMRKDMSGGYDVRCFLPDLYAQRYCTIQHLGSTRRGEDVARDQPSQRGTSGTAAPDYVGEITSPLVNENG